VGCSVNSITVTISDNDLGAARSVVEVEQDVLPPVDMTNTVGGNKIIKHRRPSVNIKIKFKGKCPSLRCTGLNDQADTADNYNVFQRSKSHLPLSSIIDPCNWLLQTAQHNVIWTDTDILMPYARQCYPWHV
jgi:hypothetical protein